MSFSLRAAALIAAAVVLTPLRSEACRGPFPPLPKNVARAAAIFVGTVVEVRPQGGGKLLLVFTVEERLKGTLGPTVEVQGSVTTCGFGAEAKKGDRFLMFAFGTPLGTDATAGNRSMDRPETEKLLAEVRTLLAPH